MKKVKRLTAVILSALMMTSAFSVLPVSAAEVESNTSAVSSDENFISGDYEYSLLDDGTVEISKYVGNDSDVTIPDEIDNIPVTVIDEHSLRNKNIRQIIIPQNIVSIKQNAIPSNYHILLCFKNSELPSWWNHRANKYIYFRTILNFLYSGKTSDNFEYAVIFDGKDKKVAITEYKGEAET